MCSFKQRPCSFDIPNFLCKVVVPPFCHAVAPSCRRAVAEHWPVPLSGLVVTRYGHGVPVPGTEVVEASQPVPDSAGRDAAARILELVDGLGAGHVVSGYDFVFGHKRGGNCELLLAMGAKKGFGFTAVNAQTDSSGEAYSSTRVRERLGDADPRGAAAILGRDFEIEGRGARGEARGKSIGFPTANIPLGAYLRPALGVYAVRAAIEQENGEIWLDGVANIGVRPTFGGDGVVLEVFLFDFDDDLYGKRLRVRLVDFLRPEKKFDGVDDLKAQIAQDSAKAQKILQ